MARPSIVIDGKTYDSVPQEAVSASGLLASAYIKAGRPQTPFTKAGAKIMDVIIAIWHDLYPIESEIWYNERKEYKKNEKSITDQVHGRTGRSLASYPLPIYRVMGVVFPNFKPAERKNCLKMVKKWPLFRFANKA